MMKTQVMITFLFVILMKMVMYRVHQQMKMESKKLEVMERQLEKVMVLQKVAKVKFWTLVEVYLALERLRKFVKVKIEIWN